MREQRKAERLADYYRRNFREYLTFDNGAAKNRVRTLGFSLGAGLKPRLRLNSGQV